MEEVKKVLQWVIGSCVPLPLYVIAEAISIQPDDMAFDQDGISNDLEDIVAMCGSLVTVERGNGISRLALAHLSIEEFLQSDSIKQSSVAFFHVNTPGIHRELAKTCIQYLSFSDFEEPCPANEIGNRHAKYKLFSYASQFWIRHLNASDMDKETFQHEILPRLRWFLDLSPSTLHYESWAQSYHCAMPSLSQGYGRKQRIPRQPAVFYVLLYRIDNLLDIMFPQGAEIHQQFWDDMTPLHIAAFAGHYPITERLLTAGAKIDSRTDCKRLTPLHVAAEQGHAQIVKILLDNGADPHARSQSGSTPLYRSLRGGSLEVLYMLRGCGSDVDARTWDDYTPLHEAVEAGNLSSVKCLLDWGVDTSVRNIHGDTPLSLAVDFFHEWEIARLIRGWESMKADA